MTPFGFAVLGFVAAVIVIAILVEAEARRLDNIDPPAWVNDGRPLEQRFVEAVDFALWTDQLREGEDA